MKTITTCPLGSECEKIVDDHIERCMWYTAVKGRNPQTDEVYDQNECAITLSTMLTIENTREVHMLNASMNSMRNETVKRQDIALKMVAKESLKTEVINDAGAS